MTEDEIRYVCDKIPLKNIKEFFIKYPKYFAKIKPGHRAKSLNKQEVASNLLFLHRKYHFIFLFIGNYIDVNLDKILAEIKNLIDEGESKESALLQRLPRCVFGDNIELFFKLTGEKYTEEFISLLSVSIKIIEERNQVNTQLNNNLESERKRFETELSKMNQKLDDKRNGEIKKLKSANADLEKSNAAIVSLEQIIESLKQKAQELEDNIQRLSVDLSISKAERLQLEQIIEKLEKQPEPEMFRQDATHKPKRPKDLVEFKEYLGDNFENIGVPTEADFYPLLKDHLCEILFKGKPIIISRSTGLTLIKCISNTLENTSIISILSFTNEVTEKNIISFMSQDKRLLCLDNFIGNYNETLLIQLCDRYKDKIICLTADYDHTLAYVPDELMIYCHYLNLNRIEAFIGEKELTEDQSDVDVDEVEVEVASIVPDDRWSTALKEILGELNVRGALSAYKKSLVYNELSLCRLLAFDVLPYCVDVLKIAPFNVSERLVKYAGVRGRCAYKDLFWRWFSL
jgi:hypothetical protein